MTQLAGLIFNASISTLVLHSNLCCIITTLAYKFAGTFFLTYPLFTRMLIWVADILGQAGQATSIDISGKGIFFIYLATRELQIVLKMYTYSESFRIKTATVVFV